MNKLGGDIVRPYQPAKYYAPLNFPERDYTASTGEDQFRRAVYTHWQRQFLHPFLLAFDAPTREECTALRPISSTPTAALVLLNDPSFVEAARALAAKILGESAGRRRQAHPLGLAAGAGPRRRRRARAKCSPSCSTSHRKEYTADTKAAEAILDGRHFAAAEEYRHSRTGCVDFGQPRAVESERNDYAQLDRQKSQIDAA